MARVGTEVGLDLANRLAVQHLEVYRMSLGPAAGQVAFFGVEDQHPVVGQLRVYASFIVQLQA